MQRAFPSLQGSHFPAVTKFKGFPGFFKDLNQNLRIFFEGGLHISVSVHNTTFYMTTIPPKYETSPLVAAKVKYKLLQIRKD